MFKWFINTIFYFLNVTKLWLGSLPGRDPPPFLQAASYQINDLFDLQKISLNILGLYSVDNLQKRCLG